MNNRIYPSTYKDIQAVTIESTAMQVQILPCHFWTFKEHGGNPQTFFEAMDLCTRMHGEVFDSRGGICLQVIKMGGL